MTASPIPPNYVDSEGLESQGDENTPLLPKETAKWKKARGFYWIQIAIFSNVFLGTFDTTVTAATWATIGSDFKSANLAAWLSTSYLITSTIFQPLYGRFSDIFGRRAAFFVCTPTFALGSFGCGMAPNMPTFIAMRLLQGIGGAGLMTIATVVNSDLIPFSQRGMYQAAQNVLAGFGAICGASFGGVISDSIGWRWCFLLQVPVSVWATILGYYVIRNPSEGLGCPSMDSRNQVWKKVDFTGALLLISGLSLQLVGLSLGGNDLPWSSIWVISAIVGSVVLMLLCVLVEAKTTAIPIVPLKFFHGLAPAATQISNVLVGMSAYAFLFMVPLYFQVVHLESAAKAGLRLIIPSIASPLGGLISGFVMSRWGRLSLLVRVGAGLMAIGNLLVMTFKLHDARWKYIVYLFPANLGQGIVYPGLLFTTMAAFDHSDHAVSASTVYLVRSIGWVWGVAISSATVQNTLKSRLPAALTGVPNKWEVIDEIRHSVTAIKNLPLDTQAKVQRIYFEGIRLSFVISSSLAIAAFVAAFLTRGRGLNRESG